MATFGCSQRMATQAMHLSLEKGILATPNPKTGKKLPENVSEAVEHFYRQDDISRVMPGKKGLSKYPSRRQEDSVSKKTSFRKSSGNLSNIQIPTSINEDKLLKVCNGST